MLHADKENLYAAGCLGTYVLYDFSFRSFVVVCTDISEPDLLW
jgi:hypothetical protein